MIAADPHDLARFVLAQGPVLAAVEAELTAGRKRTHWMWFIFPQLRALGRSETALFYGIGSLDEAKAYLAHAELGPRLIRHTRLAIDAPAASLHDLFGSPDDLKFRSSMTLFAIAAAGGDGAFAEALDRWCDGVPDAGTLSLLGRPASA